MFQLHADIVSPGPTPPVMNVPLPAVPVPEQLTPPLPMMPDTPTQDSDRYLGHDFQTISNEYSQSAVCTELTLFTEGTMAKNTFIMYAL